MRRCIHWRKPSAEFCGCRLQRVAVKKPCCPEKKALTNRTALQPYVPVPCQRRLCLKGASPLGFVAYTIFLRSVIPHRVRNLPPKFAWRPPNPQSRAEEVIVEDAEPYHENPPLAPRVPPSTLPLRPKVPPVSFSASSLPRAVLPIPLFVPRASPQRSSLSGDVSPMRGLSAESSKECRYRLRLRSTRMGKHGSGR